MDIKLICSDIDGTLLNKDRELSKATIEQVKRLSHIPFVLISSRMPQAMTHLQEQLGIDKLSLIAYNGGLILKNNSVVDSTVISTDIMGKLYQFTKNTELHFSLYHGYEWYVPKLDYWAKREANNTKVNPNVQAVDFTIDKWGKEGKGAHKIMIMGNKEELDSVVEFIHRYFDSDIIGYRSKDTYLEIAPKSVSKKTALEFLLNSHYTELTLKNVVAFGDNYNDVEMLNAVGVSVAVSNAIEEVLVVSNTITDTNKNDGVAKFLRDFL
ncbi:HAD family phosphatase [Aureibaculum marinum]|uniref:HAD family phosphatase n=1 Tax=Aureibaculum marinum TaxID=2487930 RepID=A0A3N4P0B1_9FLAO|nr:Cof-type HAD-IIB family hydrolase [Aureibaculum marinum]RPD99888.1 HAD family phosphatase [Aureibaculum marinum]